MPPLDEMLKSLYNPTEPSSTDGGVVKTAEAIMIEELQGSGEENPYMKLPLEELLKMAAAAEEAEKTASATPEAKPEAKPEEVSEEDLEKTAQDIIGGQIMAHAAVHEMGLIKEAVKGGKCRVCKTAAHAKGSSMCDECAKA